MDTETASQIRSMIFERTSPVASDAVASMEEDMWQTQADAERGITDATPYGYDTVWAQVGTRDFEDEAPGWDMDPAEIRAAYDIVNKLDHDTLAAFDRNETHNLITTIKTQAKTAAKTENGDLVTCPKCNGKQGFSQFSHVPYKNVGGLCYQCDGYGVITVADAEKYQARKNAEKAARTAKEQARAEENKAKEQKAHDDAFDRYGDEYRLVYALARYDHSATLGCVIDLNAYRANNKTAMRRVRDRLEYIIQDAGLAGLGLEEIEALGTIDIH